MNTRIYLSLILAVTLLNTSCSQTGNYEQYSGETAGIPGEGITEPVKVYIIYDNYVFRESTSADWGYSVLIEGLEKTVLFDTGTDPDIFENNFNTMGLDAGKIDEVFISHEHGDHIGGLGRLLSMNPGIKVVVPNTFSRDFFRIPEQTGSVTELISGPVRICEGLYSSGVLGKAIPEQSLVLNTSKGLVVMTGCSHPGIIDMLEEIKADFGKNICMVFGGFHLMNSSKEDINKIIEQMKAAGVSKCGATHCTGGKQIEWFREAFGDNFVELGTGNMLIIQ